MLRWLKPQAQALFKVKAEVDEGQGSSLSSSSAQLQSPRSCQQQGHSSAGNLAIRQLLKLHPTPVLLPGKSHGWRSLVGCSPWGREESDTTEQLHFHFSLSCTGEGNGNPLQCSCLENPRDGGAWWAAAYGVAQSRTRLKQLSSSILPQVSAGQCPTPLPLHHFT